MEYMEAKRSYTEAKAKQRALHKRVQTLQQKNQPMHDFKKHLETRLKRINEQRDGKKDAAKKKFKSMNTKWDENEKLVTLLSVRLEFSPIGLPRKRELRRFQTVSRISRRKKKIARRRSKKSNGLFKLCRQTWRSLFQSKICQR
jgi:structural maintenance of chromosomes protein 5